MAGQTSAEAIGQGIEEAGRGVARGFENAIQMRRIIEQLREGNLIKVEQFLKLPATTRQRLLQDPQFRADLVHSMSKNPLKKEKKTPEETPEQRVWLNSLGAERPEETATRQKAQSEAVKSQAEAAIAERKAAFATGKMKPSPIDLATNFDFKDPIAAALFTQIPDAQLKDIALAEKKQGPIYESQQMMEWYKWGTDQGFPPALAMTTARAISQGQWDKVPISYTDYTTGKVVPVRGKAEQELAVQTINARARMQEVQNNLENSIATSSAQLAEKAGISLDQARADIVALRHGKPAPFPTPHLAEMAKLDETNKQIEIDKNREALLNDRYGINTINESLKTMLSAYKEENNSILPNAAATKDLGNKITALQEELSKRLGERYGVKLPEYGNTWAQSIGGAIKSAWGGIKATGAYGSDIISDMDAAVEQVYKDTPGIEVSAPGSALRIKVPSGAVIPKRHSPEQLKVLDDMATTFNNMLADPNTPVEQKKKVLDFIDRRLMPAKQDPDKFYDLFLPGGVSGSDINLPPEQP
jgi:hypothetical protein